MRYLPSRLLKAAGMVLALSTAAAGQEYPARPVRLIVPSAPGGSNDTVGRLIATQLGERLGRQMIVDNRGGAGTVIGTELAAKNAPKDGYTLSIISIAHAVNPWIYDLKGRYDPIKSFTPDRDPRRRARTCWWSIRVCRLRAVTELIALAKQSPGKLGVGPPPASAAFSSTSAVRCSSFRPVVKFLGVRFKGGGPAMIDVIAGHNQVMFSSLVQTTPQIQAGKLRALGVGGKKRSPGILPRCPR